MLHKYTATGMATKSRIRNLSTRYLTFYKLSVTIVLGCLIGLFLWNGYNEYQEGKGLGSLLFAPMTYGYLIYIWYRVNRSVLHVEFDEEFMYVMLNKQDLLIPLENIKDVNLVSMGGVYRVDLYAKELVGEKFYFKPSLLYPLNHKKKEAVVDILWSNIEKAKRRRQHFQANALHS